MIEATLELNKVNEIAPDEDTIVFNDEGKVETYYIQRFPNGTIMVGDPNSPYHTELREDGMYVVSEDGIEFSHFNKDGFEIGGKYGKLQGTNTSLSFVEPLIDGSVKEHFKLSTKVDTETTEQHTLSNSYQYTKDGTYITMTCNPIVYRWTIPKDEFLPTHFNKIELTFVKKDGSHSSITRKILDVRVDLNEWEWTTDIVGGVEYVHVKKAVFNVNNDIPDPSEYDLSYAYLYYVKLYSVLEVGDWWVNSMRQSSGTIL